MNQKTIYRAQVSLNYQIIIITTMQHSITYYHIMKKAIPCPIITHLDVKFSNANRPGNIRSILEDILKILRLEQKKYWLDNVLPYSDKDTHIDKVNQVISSIFSSWDNLIDEIKEQLKKIRIVKVDDTGDFEKDFKIMHYQN